MGEFDGPTDRPPEPDKAIQVDRAVLWRRAATNWWQVALVAIAFYVAWTIRESARSAERSRYRTELVQQSQRAARESQEKREYIAKRRGDCYAIYDKERAKYSNVQEPEYDAESDECVIRYKHNGPSRTNDACKVIAGHPTFWDTVSWPLARRMRYDCSTNTFTGRY